MSAKEVCDLLKISRMTLHRRIEAKQIEPLPKNPAHVKRYRLEFRREDVEKLNGEVI